MIFGDNFFKEEVREGFYISGQMKRYWAAQLEILSDIAFVCKKHNIKWFADFGTLLGAVRHGGFIPWDDDLDICMLRDDYTKFNQVAQVELSAISDKYKVLNYHTEGFWQNDTRVVNCDTLIFEEEFLKKYHDCIYPAGIDIFCLDYVSRDVDKENRRKEKASLIMTSAVSCDFSVPFCDDTIEICHSIECMCNVKFKYNESLKEQLYELGEKYFTMFSKEDADKVAMMNCWLDYNNHVYPISYFEGALTLPFENIEIPVPMYYLEKLKADYGDYVHIDRASGFHGYPLYEINETSFINALAGKYPFMYTFSMDDLENGKRKDWNRLREYVLDLLPDFVDAGKDIYEVLQECQDVAIKIGESIEQLIGEGSQIVKKIEKYCEDIFALFENVKDEDNTKDVSSFKDLQLINSSIKGDIKEYFNNKITVILTCHDYDFSKLKSLYYEEKCSREVLVVVLPYYERDAGGALRKEFFDGDKYPERFDDLERISYVSYKDIDLKQLHPHKIITQMGQDFCGYTETINPNYYTSVIKAYTDELVYVAPYITNDLDDRDNKAKKSMEHYAVLPAVSHCDAVIVHSENIKNAYVDILTRQFGEEYKEVWSSKIKYRSDIVNLETYQSRNKKKVLFYISASTVIIYREKAIKKIREIASIFDSTAEKVEYSCYMSEAELRYIKACEKTRYEELIGLLPNINSNIEDVDSFDAYYGEPSPMMKHFRYAGKPIMLMDMTVLQ